MGFDKNDLDVLLQFMKSYIFIKKYYSVVRKYVNQTHTSYYLHHSLPVQSWLTVLAFKDSHSSYHNCNLNHCLPAQSWRTMKASKESHTSYHNCNLYHCQPTQSFISIKNVNKKSLFYYLDHAYLFFIFRLYLLFQSNEDIEIIFFFN